MITLFAIGWAILLQQQFYYNSNVVQVVVGGWRAVEGSVKAVVPNVSAMEV